MWELFNDYPARRDLYINLSRSDNFPFMFSQRRCFAKRWLEDESVASRAIDIWKFLVSVEDDQLDSAMPSYFGP